MKKYWKEREDFNNPENVHIFKFDEKFKYMDRPEPTRF